MAGGGNAKKTIAYGAGGNASSSSCCDAFDLLEVDNASVILVPGNSVIAQMSVN